MKRSCAVVGLLCAWVLWEHTEFRGIPEIDGKPRVVWGIGEIFETRTACEKHLEKQVAEAIADKSHGFTASVIARRLFVTVASVNEKHAEENRKAGYVKHGNVTTYRCFPSGVDPRPRSPN